MESFLKNYTEQVEPLYSYESKFSYEKEFDSFRGMFLLLGGVLSGVIAVVGTLNFLNAILTGMIARRREFAVLQSVGMTRRQLKRMLVYEGLLYTFAAIVISLILVVASEPFMGKMIEKCSGFPVSVYHRSGRACGTDLYRDRRGGSACGLLCGWKADDCGAAEGDGVKKNNKTFPNKA